MCQVFAAACIVEQRLLLVLLGLLLWPASVVVVVVVGRMVLRDECLHPEWLWRKELVCFVLLLAASCFATSAVAGVGVQSCCRRLVVDCRRHVAGHCCWHAVRLVVVEAVRRDLRRCVVVVVVVDAVGVGVAQVEELAGRCRFGASFRNFPLGQY